jgi:hypothetical protein
MEAMNCGTAAITFGTPGRRSFAQRQRTKRLLKVYEFTVYKCVVARVALYDIDREFMRFTPQKHRDRT